MLFSSLLLGRKSRLNDRLCAHTTYFHPKWQDVHRLVVRRPISQAVQGDATMCNGHDVDESVWSQSKWPFLEVNNFCQRAPQENPRPAPERGRSPLSRRPILKVYRGHGQKLWRVKKLDESMWWYSISTRPQYIVLTLIIPGIGWVMSNVVLADREWRLFPVISEFQGFQCFQQWVWPFVGQQRFCGHANVWVCDFTSSQA